MCLLFSFVAPLQVLLSIHFKNEDHVNYESIPSNKQLRKFIKTFDHTEVKNAFILL